MSEQDATLVPVACSWCGRTLLGSMTVYIDRRPFHDGCAKSVRLAVSAGITESRVREIVREEIANARSGHFY